MTFSARFIFSSILIQCITTTAVAQSCAQPGSLLSIRNSYRSHLEYLIFTFVDPYPSKGELHKTDKAVYSQPFITNSNGATGEQFYTITFNNAFTMCDVKNYCVLPQAKIKSIKLLYKTEVKITYSFSLAKNVRITSHTAYDYHGFHIVKIRVE